MMKKVEWFSFWISNSPKRKVQWLWDGSNQKWDLNFVISERRGAGSAFECLCVRGSKLEWGYHFAFDHWQVSSYFMPIFVLLFPCLLQTKTLSWGVLRCHFYYLDSSSNERKKNEKWVAFTYMVLAHRFFNK